MAKERYMYGTVLCQKNSDGEKYFINLKTGDKVTVSEPYKHSAKIVLVADKLQKVMWIEHNNYLMKKRLKCSIL